MGTEFLQEGQHNLITQQEEKVHQILLSRGVDNKYPNFTVKYIQENVFLIGNEKGVYSYVTEKGEPFFNIGVVRGYQFVDTSEAVIGSGYFEKKEGDIYRLYRVLGTDENNRPVLEKSPIDPYSKDYYEAWKNILFNATLLGKTLLKKTPASAFSGEELKSLERDISAQIKTGAITIEDLESFYFGLDKNGKKQEGLSKISKDFFDTSVKRVVVEKLLLQCSDERLDKAGQGITEERLKRYYEKGYISAEMALNCVKAIRAKELKKEKSNSIGRNTGKKIEEVKP